MENTKKCVRCEQTKEFKDFHKSKNGKYGIDRFCKQCRRLIAREYVEKKRKINMSKKIEDLEGEVWKDVQGYEGLYQVSNLGRVKSLCGLIKNSLGKECMKKELILRGGKDKDGYSLVTLCKNAKHKGCKVHRLVAMHFIPNPLNLPQVNHKNENQSNNEVTNLEWCTNKYNVNYGSRSERQGTTSSKTVYQYTLEGGYIKEWKTADETRNAGFNRGSVCGCCIGKCETYSGYRWSYEYKPLGLEIKKKVKEIKPTKICTVCGEELPNTLEYFRNRRYCRKCESNKGKEYRLKKR